MAETKLGSISQKPKACEDIYMSSRSETEGSSSTLASHSTPINVVTKKSGFGGVIKNKYERVFALPLSFTITEFLNLFYWKFILFIIWLYSQCLIKYTPPYFFKLSGAKARYFGSSITIKLEVHTGIEILHETGS